MGLDLGQHNFMYLVFWTSSHHRPTVAHPLVSKSFRLYLSPESWHTPAPALCRSQAMAPNSTGGREHLVVEAAGRQVCL
jgi:hypothetical protein